MLSARALDALVVCTPPDVHREVTVAAALAGLAVYLEKPVAHTMDDAAAIAAAVKATGVVCAVGYQYRAISFLGDLPRDAALLLGTGISDTADRAWLGDRARGGGMMLERASHLIDLERALAGEVTGATALEEGAGLAASLRFAGGAVGSVVVGRVAERAGLAARADPRRRHGHGRARPGLPRARGRRGSRAHRAAAGRALARVLRRRRRAARPVRGLLPASTTASGRSRSRSRRRTPRSRRSPRWTPSARRGRRPRGRNGGRPAAGGRGDRGRGVHAGASRPAVALRVLVSRRGDPAHGSWILAAVTRSAIVTGGASGIGRAVAQRLAADGFRVLVPTCGAIPSPAASRRRADRGGRRRAEYVAADVSSRADCEALVARAVERAGRWTSS